MKINEYYPLDLEGIPQWIAVRGEKKNHILLILHGGPGTPCMNLFRKWSKPLEEDYLVVTWDQRGTGRSFTKDMDRSAMTISQLIKDIHALTDYLKRTFSKEKVYLLGHSFGATLGLKTVSLYPQDYMANFSVSQFVNTVQNESSCYDWVMSEAAGGKYKGDSHGKSSTLAVLLNMLVGREYRGRYLSNAIAGITYSLETLGKDLEGIDYPSQIPRLEIPVYFFSGDYDQLTPQHLLREYFGKLKAPKKELFIFENSAHSPLWEERDKFHKIMHDLVT